MNVLKYRQNSDKSYTYYIQGQGVALTNISFIQYKDFEGLYTVNKDGGEYHIYLPQKSGEATYFPLWKILDKGYVVYLIS